MAFATVPAVASGDTWDPAAAGNFDKYVADNLNTGVWRPIDDTVGDADVAVDIQSIPATFRHLVLVIRGTGPTLRFNNDSGANYDSQNCNTDGATVTAAEDIGGTNIGLGVALNSVTHAIVWIGNYASTNMHKPVRSVSAHNEAVNQVAGFWRSTAAINRITTTGRVVTLYGVPD